MIEPQFLKEPLTFQKNQTSHWKGPIDIPENYSDTATHYKEDEIVYKHNNYGFRCDDFDSWTNHPYRVLFAGCSYTEGTGLPLKEIWPHIVYESIQRKAGTEIPFWSIAQGETGLDQMVRYLYHVGDIIKPQIIISQLPHMNRREIASDVPWLPVSYNGTEVKHDIEHWALNPEFVRYQTEKNFAMLNLMLEKWDAIFLFNKTDLMEDISDITERFPRIIEKSTPVEDIFLDITMDIARDGLHPGPLAHMLCAEKMFDHFWPVIKEKLGLT